MTTFRRLPWIICLSMSLLAAQMLQIAPAYCADFKHDVIYHIITDRFYNGRTDNDDPPQSKGMFDGTRKNWQAYWGGDFEGIRQKLPYIKSLGATAIMISPPVDNINKPINDSQGTMMAPYHSYWARDFTRIEEHFADPADPDVAWKDFDKLVKAAHDSGIKVIIDLPLNHTSPYNHGEFGALYDAGEFRSDLQNDKNKYFHHLPLISNWNDRYQVQYGTLLYLSDLSQENSYIDTYLQNAVQRFQKHGVDGTRLDAAKHTNWGWQQALANTLYKNKDHLVVGEWIITSTSEPLYKDAVKFTNKGGLSLFDYALATSVRKAFSSKNGSDGKDDKDSGFIDVDRVIAQEYKDFADADGLVTFIDNHDIPRLLSLNGDNQSLDLATAFLMTCRGIPCIYYGTEQYLHDDTKGGEDPYDRPQMTSFDQDSTLYQRIQKLCSIRASNPALIYGAQKTLYVTADAYVFERRFGNDSAVIALNKNKTKSVPVSFTTSLPESDYKDSLDGSFAGVPLKVGSEGTVQTLEIPPHSVAIWQNTSNVQLPSIGSVRPPVVIGGGSVQIAGGGFGNDRGKVMVGKEEANVTSWTPESITISAPALSSGVQPVKVSTKGGSESNQSQMTIVEAKLIPIQFVLKSAPVSPPDLNPEKAQGEQIFITGNVVSLGSGKRTWMDAAGPMLFSEDRDFVLTVAMPSNQKVELKFVILDSKGNVLKEESTMHKYQVPAFGAWTVQTKWMD